MEKSSFIIIRTGILGCIFATLAACAPTNVTVVSETTTQLPRPNQLLVYNFAVSPGEVELDEGISAKLSDYMSGTSRTQEEINIGRQVSDALATHLVEELQSFGFPVQRAAGPPPIGVSILAIRGQFLSIDEGNRTERVVIGLGLGRTDVKTYVQLYDLSGQSRRIVEQFEVDAKSGAKPGMAETMGVGAAAGHLATSAALGGALAVGSEAFSANVDADAKRTAKKIAKQLGDFFVSQGWIPPGAVQ